MEKESENKQPDRRKTNPMCYQENEVFWKEGSPSVKFC